ncbi:MAG TPA: NADH-quinone oxidoreductase subunit C [Verrucomicrobiales bacterium]|nr:NADH-quinone oxidoreductase subunit C [Verrucomicrobiales bacterium]
MTAADAASQLRNAFPESTFDAVEFRGEHTVVAAGSALREILRHCRDQLGFDYLVDISSLDHFGEEPRFEMVYELYGYAHGSHLRIRARVSEDHLEVDTVSDLWPTADWHEREVYDMMGIRFRNHPDLRRILMWEGYPFFPLRKDFPLAGKPSAMPDVAFSGIAPLEGGPFVTSPSSASTAHREPRSREV